MQHTLAVPDKTLWHQASCHQQVPTPLPRPTSRARLLHSAFGSCEAGRPASHACAWRCNGNNLASLPSFLHSPDYCRAGAGPGGAPPRVLLLLVKQGGNGLNLTEAQHVVLVEPLLDPGVEAQAVGRVHRIGQTRPTFVHRWAGCGAFGAQ
jgi:hypothetical protein